ncbi:MAG: Ribosomal RNA small subunit methyltransferase E [Pelotomaculum sp. PtaU1.Bin035]|nr:MAG: Ribosomal RNA small subunit methyltransferase E [Pelotomaculum sp. PtaU1.Bin035]
MKDNLSSLHIGRPRFFVSPEQIDGGRVYLKGPDVVHLAKVLRMGAGESLTVLDGRGKTYLAVIKEVGRDKVTCTINKELPGTAVPSFKVTLVQGIPKGDKMDLIIQKGTELGLSKVIPLLCERVVVKLEGDKPLRRRERWQRIALEAAKQCRRPDVPEISEPTSWEQALAALPPGVAALIPWEEEITGSLREFFHRNPAPEEIYIFIGPEGGFTRAEVERARFHGVCPVTLGPRILRTETAGLAVLSVVLYQWGDLGG